jgi:hypothetical protein
MKLYKQKASENKRQIISYFKLIKLKEFENGCTPLVMMALFGEKRRRRGDGYLCGQM